MFYSLILLCHIFADNQTCLCSIKSHYHIFVDVFLLLLVAQLKETIEKVRAGDKICLDIILIIIIIGMIGLIIKIAKGM